MKNRAGKWCKKNQIAIAIWENYKELDKINCPTLILYGAKDGLISGEKTLLEGIKEARSVIIDGVSHFPQKEDPESFTEAVLAFL